MPAAPAGGMMCALDGHQRAVKGAGAMLAYFCEVCRMFYREVELLPEKRCPECRGVVKPRLVLAGQVMGAEGRAPS